MRRVLGDTVNVTVDEAEVGQKVIELEMPLVATFARLHARDAAGELSVLRRVGVKEDLDGFDGIDRQAHAEIAGRGIDGVHAVDEQRALTFARSVETQLTRRRPQYAWHER